MHSFKSGLGSLGSKMNTYSLTLEFVIVGFAQGQGQPRRSRGCRRAHCAAGGPGILAAPPPRGVCVAVLPEAAPPAQPLRRPGRRHCTCPCGGSHGGHRRGLATAHGSGSGIYLGRKKRFEHSGEVGLIIEEYSREIVLLFFCIFKDIHSY